MSEWISAEDKLPEEFGRYLVIIFNKHFPENKPWTECVDWTASGWYEIYHATVTHWMPLPEPPESEDA